VLVLTPQNGDGSDTVVISTWPFTVGRSTGKDLQINARDVSSSHASLNRGSGGEWTVEDNDSTNGTFLNGERIDGLRTLAPGDVIHFAGQAYRVMDSAQAEDDFGQTVVMADDGAIRGNLELVEILENRQLLSHFQPIFDAQSGHPVAWEALGRGITGGELMPPGKMFSLAERFNLNYQLSQGLRDAALDCVSCNHCWKSSDKIEIWINLHPSEVMHPSFGEDVRALQSRSEDAQFAAVIEAPETWVSKTDEMRDLVARVRDAGMRVAYDDFGAGQSRLHDLMSVPPDYIKFDRALITNVAEDLVKRDLLQAMIKASDTLNATTLAEGVETKEEFEACRDLGIKLIQGFYLQRPKPAYELFSEDLSTLPPACQHRRLNTA